MSRWAMFCEARADFETASGFVDRVLRERGVPWVKDAMAEGGVMADAVRSWHGADRSVGFFDIHKVYGLAEGLGLRRPQGHFGGRPASAGAVLVATILQIVRKLNQQARDEKFELVCVVWDMDRQGRERRSGVEQGRSNAGTMLGDACSLIVGCAAPMREA